jgi:hypothetical protein
MEYWLGVGGSGGHWRWRNMVGWAVGKMMFIWLVFLLSFSPNFSFIFEQNSPLFIEDERETFGLYWA